MTDLNQDGVVLFGPVVDGYVLPEDLSTAFKNGRYNKVPIIAGTNRDEFNVLFPAFFKKLIVTKRYYKKQVRLFFDAETAERVLEMYSVKKYKKPSKALKALLSDSFFHCPTRKLLQEINTTNTHSVFRYVYTHKIDKILLKWLGAGHAMELPYVFHHFPKFLNIPEREMNFSADILYYWTQFAHAGNPNHSSGKDWQSYDNNMDNYLELDHAMDMKNGFRTEQCAFWDTVKVPAPGDR